MNSPAFTRADTVLDVGANLGQFGDQLLSLGYRGKLVSFEAIPSVLLCAAVMAPCSRLAPGGSRFPPGSVQRTRRKKSGGTACRYSTA